MQLGFGTRGNSAWVGGKHVYDNEPFKMEAGYIPLLLEATVGRSPSWGTGGSALAVFHEMTEGDAMSQISWRESERKRGAEGSYPSLWRTSQEARLGMIRFLSEAPAQTSSSAQHMAAGLESSLALALAFCNVMGSDMVPPDSQWLSDTQSPPGKTWADASASVHARSLFLAANKKTVTLKRAEDAIFVLMHGM